MAVKKSWLPVTFPSRHLCSNGQPTHGSLGTAVIVVLLCLVSHPANAGRFNLSVGVEAGYTDNVNLTEDKQGDMILGVFTDFQYLEQSSATEGLVEGRVEHRNYLNDQAPDEWRPDIHGNVLWHLDPERWSWALDGAWQQVRRTQLGPESPANLQNQATIWTGPDFHARLSSITTFNALVRAGYQYNSQTNDDNAGYGVALGLSTNWNDTVAVSGDLNARAVRYSETSNDAAVSLFADFNIAEATVGYARQDGHVETLIDLGVSFADIKGAENQSGFLLRLDASRDLTGHSMAGVRAFFGFDSTGSTALIRSPVPGVPAPLDSSPPGLFYQQGGEIYYEASSRRSTLSGSVLARKRSFDVGLRDETTFQAGISFTHRLTRQSEARLIGSVDHTKFDTLSTDYQDYLVGIEVSRRINRKVSGTAEVRHRRRVSDDPLREYSETAVFMYLDYQLQP